VPRAATVSREISRNGGQAQYRAAEADSAAWERALRPKCCKLATDKALAKLVTDKLRLLWSPEQIAGKAQVRPSGGFCPRARHRPFACDEVTTLVCPAVPRPHLTAQQLTSTSPEVEGQVAAVAVITEALAHGPLSGHEQT
jgi:hypothetical protein